MCAVKSQLRVIRGETGDVTGSIVDTFSPEQVANYNRPARLQAVQNRQAAQPGPAGVSPCRPRAEAALQSCSAGSAGILENMLASAMRRRATSMHRPLLVSSLLRQLTASSAAEPASCASREGSHAYTLIDSKLISNDTKLMKFALPDDMPTLGLALPSCLKIKLQCETPIPSPLSVSVVPSRRWR